MDKRGQQHETELDGIFMIEKILGKKGNKYHIQWQGYTTTTWEPSANIPKFIRDYYERTGKSTLPNPKILDTRTIGTTTEHLLTWEKDDSLPEWTPQQDIDDEVADLASCNTRKDR